jgi:hypothetical protein
MSTPESQHISELKCFPNIFFNDKIALTPEKMRIKLITEKVVH